MERATEKIKVKMLDGTDAEVLVYKSVGIIPLQEIKKELFGGMAVSKKSVDENSVELPIDKTQSVIITLAKAIWADKNYKLEDVDGVTLVPYLTERLNTFLETVGYSVKAENNTSG